MYKKLSPSYSFIFDIFKRGIDKMVIASHTTMLRWYVFGFLCISVQLSKI